MKSLNWLNGSKYLSKINTFFFLLTNNFVFHIEKSSFKIQGYFRNMYYLTINSYFNSTSII